jgi:hypothetical protein
MNQPKTLFHSVRVVASCALLGAVAGGAFFGWLPVAIGVHEIGAVVGGAVGLVANAKHLV